MDAQSNNVTHMDDLLISTVTSPVSKFAVFFWITSTFIAMSLGFKSIPYLKLAKSQSLFFRFIWNYFNLHLSHFCKPLRHKMATLLSFTFSNLTCPLQDTIKFNSIPMLHIFKQREGFPIALLVLFPYCSNYPVFNI
jgi:hypothetical protein